MASTILNFRPTGIQACAYSGTGKSDTNNRKNQSANWWTPLFAWNSDPDYIDKPDKSSSSSSSKNRLESNSDLTNSRSRFMPGCFTEEKAKQLRMKTMESATFHDIMYHSAIASRLASDVPIRSDV